MGTSEDLCCKTFSLDGGHVGIVMLARVSRQERQNCSCNFRIFLWKQSTDLAMRGGTEKKKKKSKIPGSQISPPGIVPISGVNFRFSW